MSNGLDITWRVLAKSANEAAVEVLLGALDSPRPEIAAGALRALLERRTPRGLTELVRRWDRLPEASKEIIQERPERLAGALRDALVEGEEPLFAHACQAAVALREYDLLAVMAHVVESAPQPQADLAAATLLRLAELLHDDLASARKHARHRDPLVVRTRMVAALEKAVQRWPIHQRSEILEAFLLLCPRDNATLKQILNHPHDPAYLKVLELLAHSRQPGVVRLLVGFLDDRRAPTAALQTLARRSDKPLLMRLIKKIGYEPSAVARRNFKHIRDFPWLRADPARLDALDDAGQHAVVQMVVTSSVKRSDVLPLLEHLLRHGSRGGRRAAADALRHFQGADANRLVLAALADSDPLVQAAALTHIRQRGVPGAMTRLLELLESEHETVRSAARKCLTDFSCARFLAAFDTLTPEARESTGKLVGRIDPQAARTLCDELHSPVRSRRIRALEAAGPLGVAPQVVAELLEILGENDHVLRAKAAEALRYCDAPGVREALRERLLDSHPTVQTAAEASLAHLSRRDDPAPSPAPPADLQAWDAAPLSFPVTTPPS